MRIGIDASILKQDAYKGIANTTWNIIQIWKEKYPEHEYVLVANGDLRLPERLPENWHIAHQRERLLRFIPAASGVPELIRRERIDVFWGPNHLLPVSKSGCPTVVTVCDLAWLKIPGIASAGTYTVLRLFGKKSCETADRVIAISKATARDVHEIYRIPKRKIDVCYIGADKPPAIQVNKSVKHPYFLFLSTIEPRKNPVTVLDAFERFCDNGNAEHRLVFAGAYGWKTQAFRRKLRRSPYRNRINISGYVPENKKWKLLKHATALLYPSLYEGFGLPILEAMSVGTPVITTDRSSMPEAGGDAAVYLRDPADAAELASHMRMICEMNETEKNALREKMKKQVRKFSWEQCADGVMKTLTDARCGASEETDR